MKWRYVWLLTVVVLIMCFLSSSSKRKNVETGSFGFNRLKKTTREFVSQRPFPKSRVSDDTGLRGSGNGVDNGEVELLDPPREVGTTDVDLTTSSSRLNNESNDVHERSTATGAEPILHVHIVEIGTEGLVQSKLRARCQHSDGRRGSSDFERNCTFSSEYPLSYFAPVLVEALSSALLVSDGAKSSQTKRLLIGHKHSTLFQGLPSSLLTTHRLQLADRGEGNQSSCFRHILTDPTPSRYPRRHLSFSYDAVAPSAPIVEMAKNATNPSAARLKFRSLRNQFHTLARVVSAFEAMRLLHSDGQPRPLHLVVVVLFHGGDAERTVGAQLDKKGIVHLLAQFISRRLNGGIPHARNYNRIEVIGVVLPSLSVQGSSASAANGTTSPDSSSVNPFDVVQSPGGSECPVVQSCEPDLQSQRCWRGGQDACCTTHFWPSSWLYQSRSLRAGSRDPLAGDSVEEIAKGFLMSMQL